MEHHRKETNLLSGLGVLILIVALLAFAYTQAIRQVKYQRELFQRLQEQLTMAREQMAKQGPTPDIEAMRAKIQKIRPAFLALEEVSPQVDRIKALAQQEFHLRAARWNQSEEPVDSFTVSIPGRPDCEVSLYALEMGAQGPTRSVAGLLASVGPDSELPVFPLRSLEIQGDPADPGAPLQISCRWLLPVASPLSGQESLTKPAPRPARDPAWGGREEPFLSPLDHPNALRLPPEKTASLRLTGILWDPAHPTCVINGQTLGPGEKSGAYRVVLITERSVLLEGPDGEVLLRQS